jgi:MFS family permease
MLLLGLNSGGNIVPWNHPLILASLTLSLVGLVIFWYIERYVASEPVIPVKLLLNRTVAAACLTNWFITMVAFMTTFYVPIFFQAQGLSATQAGLRLVPQSLGTSIGSLGSGLIMNHTGRYKVLGLAVIAAFVIGTFLLATLTFSTPDWPAYIYQFLVGAGYGGMLTVTLLATISAVAHDYQAVITSATYAFRSTGSAIGVTIASAVFQNILVSSLHSKFDGRVGAADEIRRIRDSLDELKHLPTGWSEGVLESYETALRGVFLTATAIAILGMISGAFMREHTLHTNLVRRG